jgi:thioredoxin 1
MKNLSIFISFLFLLLSCNSSNSQNNNTESQVFKNVSVNEFENLINTTENAQLIDVRTEGEYSTGYIPKSKNININNQNFLSEISTLDKNKPVYVYCLSGGRSGNAMKILQQNGFKQVYNLEGGIMSWKGSNKIIEMPNSSTANTSATISEENFKKLINSNSLILVDFYAPWCAPCKILSPIVESLEKEMNGAFKLEKLNYDNCNALVKPLSISSIPLLVLFKDGKEVWRKKGVSTKEELAKIIEQFK